MADYVLAYDVGTGDAAGRRRLRRIARLCKDHGQRVQLSVFEISVDDGQLELLLAEAREIVAPETDSLRVYRLHGGRESAVQVVGRDSYRDFEEPLLV